MATILPGRGTGARMVSASSGAPDVPDLLALLRSRFMHALEQLGAARQQVGHRLGAAVHDRHRRRGSLADDDPDAFLAVVRDADELARQRD